MNDNLRRVIYRTYPPHFNRSLVFSLHFGIWFPNNRLLT